MQGKEWKGLYTNQSENIASILLILYSYYKILLRHGSLRPVTQKGNTDLEAKPT